MRDSGDCCFGFRRYRVGAICSSSRFADVGDYYLGRVCLDCFVADSCFMILIIDLTPNTALEPTPTAPGVYGRFELYDDY